MKESRAMKEADLCEEKEESWDCWRRSGEDAEEEWSRRLGYGEEGCC